MNPHRARKNRFYLNHCVGRLRDNLQNSFKDNPTNKNQDNL